MHRYICVKLYFDYFAQYNVFLKMFSSCHLESVWAALKSNLCTVVGNFPRHLAGIWCESSVQTAGLPHSSLLEGKGIK